MAERFPVEEDVVGSKPIRHPEESPNLEALFISVTALPSEWLLLPRGEFFLHRLSFYEVVAAGDGAVPILEFDQARVHFSARKYLAGSHVSFGQARSHAPKVACHAVSGIHTTIRKYNSC